MSENVGSNDLNNARFSRIRLRAYNHVHLLSFMPASERTKFPFLGPSVNMSIASPSSLKDDISIYVLCISSPWSFNSWNLETPRRSASRSRVSSGDSWAIGLEPAVFDFDVARETRLEAMKPAKSLISVVATVKGGKNQTWGGGVGR